MNHFTNQSNGSQAGRMNNGGAIIRRFALFPMMLLMLLLLPAGMVAQKAPSSSKYIATYDSDTETLTFEKYEGESLSSKSRWVEDGKPVWEMYKLDYGNIKHIVINESFETFTPTKLNSFFNGLTRLETITGLEYLNTANVTDMSLMFFNCQKLTSLDLSNFNTEKVTNMEAMFSVCPKLKTIYASDKFTTAAVTESQDMFSGCSSLSGDIDWSDKAVDKTYAKIDGGYFCDKAYDNRPWVKYADRTLTFRCGYKKIFGDNEYALNSGEEKPAWAQDNKANKVVFEASFANARPTTCFAWFKNFSLLNQIEGIENLNTENVTSMAQMFLGCRNLAELDVTHFNTANVTSMISMFNGCMGLTSLDVTNFNTVNVTDMSYMFSYCNKLKEIYVSDKFVTGAVRSSAYMFMGCNSLSGDIDWKSVKVNDKTYAKTDGGYFRDKAYDNRPWVKYADGTLTFRCGYKKTFGENEYELNSGEVLPAWATNNDNITQVVFDASFAKVRPTTCFKWFYDFFNLKQIEGVENLNTENVTNMNEMFCYCSSLKSIDVTHFNTANVTDMNGMFNTCESLALLDVTHFNTANVTKMSGMFTSCSSLTELDVTNFNTANVTDMSFMFCGCKNLASLDVSHFNTAKVTDMSWMFNYCSNLTSLDVTHFNTAEVTDMSNMFYECDILASLDVAHFNTAKVTNMEEMFYNCFSLTSLDLTNFNTAKVTNMEEMFYNCSSLTTIYVSDEFVTSSVSKGDRMFSNCSNLKGFIKCENLTGKVSHHYANYKTGYFTKLVGKNGDERFCITGETKLLTVDNLTLADDKDFVAYEPFAAKAASYSRTVEGTTWATLCLPFEVSLQNQNFRAFKLLSADDAAETVELEEIKTSIEAGTPVIIKMKDGETMLSFTVANKAIAKDVLTSKTDNSNYQLQGLYTQKVFSKTADNNCYIVKGDKLMNPAKLLGETQTQFVGSKPFRAYMVDKSPAPAAGARMFSIRLGDGTTAIKQLEADAADAADAKAEYYDLQGHRLQDLQKGVNIVKRGGKTMKVVIK